MSSYSFNSVTEDRKWTSVSPKSTFYEPEVTLFDNCTLNSLIENSSEMWLIVVFPINGDVRFKDNLEVIFATVQFVLTGNGRDP